MALLEDIAPSTQPEGVAFDEIRPEEAKFPPQSLEDLTALKIVVQDAVKAEAWALSAGLSLEWDRADRLYLFQVPTAYWEGTGIERAHLGMPLVFEHVESILPQVLMGLYQDDPPFMSKPRPGTKMEAARANDAILGWELAQSNFRDETRLGLKSCLLYGMGIWKLGWKTQSIEHVVYQRKAPTEFVPLQAGGGQEGGVNIPQSDEVEAKTVVEEINQPTFEAVNIRHILVDPGCCVSDIRKARFVIHRIYLNVEDLDALRDYHGYNIPEREQLRKLLFPPKETPLNGQLEKSTIGNFLDEFKAAPREEQTSVDPMTLPLECLEYWTKDRVYTVLQRKLVIRNEANEWGEIPFRSLAYSDVMDSFWGIGIAKLVGNEQRMQQGVINAFLDDLSLSLNGMFWRVRGKNTPTAQIRMRPGGVIDVDEKDGVGVLQRQPIPVAETAAVISASDARAQRRTAANELVVQGSLPSEKSSITRTATGVQYLAGGAGARLQGNLIENFASQVFIPTLEAFHRMNGRKLTPSQINKLLSDDLAQAYDGDPLDLVNARVQFNIVAAAKLQSRRAMANFLPMLFQFVLTEPVMTSLQQEGKKVNVTELVNMLFDVSGFPNRQDIIVRLNEEDEARALMNNPAIQGILQQQSQLATQQDQKLQAVEEENIARVGRDIIRSLLKQAEARAVGQPTAQPAA